MNFVHGIKASAFNVFQDPARWIFSSKHHRRHVSTWTSIKSKSSVVLTVLISMAMEKNSLLILGQQELKRIRKIYSVSKRSLNNQPNDWKFPLFPLHLSLISVHNCSGSLLFASSSIIFNSQKSRKNNFDGKSSRYVIFNQFRCCKKFRKLYEQKFIYKFRNISGIVAR